MVSKKHLSINFSKPGRLPIISAYRSASHLNTAVALSALRDDIKNQHYVVEEADITLAQSKFEPPATIRQAEIALDKAKRSLEQKNKGYDLKVQQNLADIWRRSGQRP